MSDARHVSSDGDPRAGATVVVGIVLTILILALVVFTQALFYHAQSLEDERDLSGPRPQELADLQFKQLAQLHSRRYVDPAKGIVAIPIDDAINLYVARMTATPAPATRHRAQAETRSTTQSSGASPTTASQPRSSP